MKAEIVKKGVLEAFNGILSDLTISELEDMQDKLSVHIHKFVDDKKRYSLDDVKKQLKNS